MAEVAAAKAGVTVAIEVANAIAALEYKSTGEACPGCKHGGVAKRTLGVLWGRHDQSSCGCRLARQKNGAYPCGCEWTHDQSNRIHC